MPSAAYKFDEDMADPFGSKKPTVMNTPPKRDPMGGGLQQPRANFHDEFAAAGGSNEVEQPTAGAQLIQCDTCERKFNAKALEKHSKICVKVF